MVNEHGIRKLVRDVLREELANIAPGAGSTARPARSAQPRVETVTVRNDNELMAFVRRIVRLASDSGIRRALDNGEMVFRLAPADGVPAPAPQNVPAVLPLYARGLVSEQQIDALDEDVRRIEVGRSVRFTPLALDRLRQRGIKVKRITS